MIRTWLYTLWALVVLAGIMAVLLMSRPAAAQQVCGPAAEMIDYLATRFGEVVVVRGKTPDAEMVLTRSASGAWTVLVLRGGTACAVLAGTASEVDKGV